MTTFDDRERGFETKFARDEDMLFRVHARRNKLVGLWVAEALKMSPADADAYAKTVVQADFEEAGDADVIRKVIADLKAGGVETDEAAVNRALADCEAEARRQLMEGK
jgi:hypothetical protein